MFATHTYPSAGAHAKSPCFGRLSVGFLLMFVMWGCSGDSEVEAIDPIEAELKAAGIEFIAQVEEEEDNGPPLVELSLGYHNILVPTQSGLEDNEMPDGAETESDENSQEYATVTFELFGLVEEKNRETVEELLEERRGPFNDAVIQIFRRAGSVTSSAGVVALSDSKFVDIKLQLVEDTRRVLGREYISSFVIANLTIDGQ